MKVTQKTAKSWSAHETDGENRKNEKIQIKWWRKTTLAQKERI